MSVKKAQKQVKKSTKPTPKRSPRTARKPDPWIKVFIALGQAEIALASAGKLLDETIVEQAATERWCKAKLNAFAIASGMVASASVEFAPVGLSLCKLLKPESSRG